MTTTRSDRELLRNVTHIAHIPAVLIHGRLHLSSPPDIPWQLAQSWPAAQLHIVPGGGHSAGGAISDQVVNAPERVRTLAATSCS
jgi:proline iminopeptidase